jgi:hypothetical protein
VELDEDDELQRALAASLEDSTAQVPDAGNLESTTQFVEPEPAKEELPNAVAGEASKPITYPELPEEPVLSNPSICRVGIRFPDGRRGQRKFSKTDPIKVEFFLTAVSWTTFAEHSGSEWKSSVSFSNFSSLLILFLRHPESLKTGCWVHLLLQSWF